MREMILFYKQHVDECQELAKHATDDADQTFWEEAAHRWGAILQQHEKAGYSKGAK
jgi:hypothetical protein